MIWEWFTSILEDTAAQKDREANALRMQRFEQSLLVMGFDISNMIGLTGICPTNFKSPEPRLMLVNHVNTPTEVFQSVAAEYDDPSWTMFATRTRQWRDVMLPRPGKQK